MNNFSTFSLWVVSLILLPVLLSAQGFTRSGNMTDRMNRTGITPGAYVPNQTILTFSDDSDKAFAADVLKYIRKRGGTVLKTSPTQKYMLVDWGKSIRLGDYCDFIGNGTTLVAGPLKGTEVDLNYYVGASPNGNIYQAACSDVTFIEADAEVEGSEDPDFSDYSPLRSCSTPHDNIVPIGGNTVVNVAIIDSYFGNNILTRFGGLPVRQELENNNLGQNAHGSTIAFLIAGQAHVAGVADKIQLHSYPVLNHSLEGTVYDVIEALETAALPENEINIVNLSLSFKTLTCALEEAPEETEQDLSGNAEGEYNTPGTPINDKPITAAQVNSILEAPLKKLEEANILVINAAGNDGGILNSTSPVFPVMESGLSNMVNVGALGCGANQIAEWSNQGRDYIDLYAPGTNIKPYTSVIL